LTPSEDMLAAAHEYRRRAWRVIQLHSVGPDGRTCSCQRGAQCPSAGKHPIENRWQNSPAYSAADIQALWDERPNANIGIATGLPSGFWVLDIDPKSGGMESMGNLTAAHGALPATFVVKTGSGGYHYYFLLPDDFEVQNDQSGYVAPGIDVRGRGGQVVAAPSVTDKGPYEIVTDLPVAQAPQWLLDAVHKPEHGDVEIITADDLPKPEDIEPAEWDRLNRYANQAIGRERDRLRKLELSGWDGEPWNGTTFEVSCALIEFVNSPWCSYSLGQARNDVMTLTPRDTEGFDNYTVAKTFQSAVNTVGEKARAMPENRQREPDPLFEGVEDRSNPTEGDGSEGHPVVGAQGPARFFNEKGTELLARELANGVLELGPIGLGRDRDFWRYEGGVWRSDPDIVMHRSVDLLGNSYRPRHLSAAKDIVHRLARPITADPVPDYMNFRNGMLHWQTGVLEEHDPDFGSTIQFPLDYNPEAACPNFDKFLGQILHEDYVALAWEMLGYLMYSGNPQQVAFLFYGGGQNGKGTLIRVIEGILGRKNIAHESLDQLNKSTFSAVNLYGKIANIAGDIDATYQESTANFKKITGEDTIGAERKFGDRFDFENWAVPLFSANKIPGSADVTEGYLRRWIVLHFHKHIAESERITGLSDLLQAELEGIAAKALVPLRTLMVRDRFDPQGEATKGKEEFAQAIDKVRHWVASGDAIESPETLCPLMDLYSSYAVWAERSGQRKVSEQEFSHRLENIGYPTKRENAQLCHVGLLVSPTERQAHVWSDL
jgi:P4 family phage/plasmid primase-like protien